MKNIVLSCGLLMIVGFTLTTTTSAAPYNKDYFGQTEVYKAAFEDTLIHLARNNALGFVELRAANPTLDPWIPGAGAQITLPKQNLLPDAPRKGLIINLAEMRVYYFKDEGKEPLTYPISIGREGLQTPQGTTSIVRKKEDPTWRPTPRMREEHPELPAEVGPGPENPLGTHAMYLGWPQYAMHGTNKPYGVGRRVSSGCIRMYPEHIKELFPLVPVGTQVTVVDQPVKVGWIDDQLYVEVSPTQDQSIKIEEDGVVKSYEITAADMKRITEKAGNQADKINWEIVRKAVQDHSGIPVAVIGGRSSSAQASDAHLEKLMDEADLSQKQKEMIEEKIQQAEAAPEPQQAVEEISKQRMKYNLNR